MTTHDEHKGAIPVTHDDIADYGAEYLRRKGYPFSWSNMRSMWAGEQPDVMAIRSSSDVVIMEVKVSRSDFLADRKKHWRQEGKGRDHSREKSCRHIAQAIRNRGSE